jgi:UDP-glucose 4-epimerase
MSTARGTWVGDVVRANVLAGDSDRVGKGEPINIGSGRGVSIARIAELVGGPVVHGPPRGFDERFKQAGIARAQELLGWEPRVHIEEGMRRLMESVGSPAR